jgi:hypothetical protein
MGGLPVKDLFAMMCLLLATVLKVRRLRFHSKASFIFLIFYLWLLTTTLIQASHGELKFIVRQFAIWGLLIPMGITCIDTQYKFLKILDTLIKVSFIVSIFSIYEEVTGFNIFGLLNTEGTILNYNANRFGLIRILSFTSHTISYCVYCMFIICLILYRISTLKKNNSYFKFLIACYFFNIACAFFTMSRSSIVCLILSQILILWFAGYRQFIKKTVQFTLIAFICIGISWLIFPKVREALTLIYYVVVVIFDDRYSSYLISAGLTQNTGGVGDRFKLYSWVYSDLKGNLMLGMGKNVEFSHSFLKNGYSVYKESIEVQYLRTLWRYGMIGMITEIAMYLSLMVETLKRQWRTPHTWEGQYSFVKCFGALVISYLLVFFAVMQNEDVQIFQLLVMLFVAYICNGNKFNNSCETL